MAFDKAVASSYDRFMGRFSSTLSPQLADLAGVRVGQRVIDVGCGPGALTAELVRRVGADHVAAVDPSVPFAAATRERYPGADVRDAAAEDLPFPDRTFDAALAQLVVQFMKDPVRGLGEMKRVTRSGGRVAACVWDSAGGRSPLSIFWKAAQDLDPTADAGSRRPGGKKGSLPELFAAAGITEVEETELTATVRHPDFEDWWAPFTLRIGPPGEYAASLSPERLAALREHCRELMPKGPFTNTAVAWAACGVVP
jgi:SAM-dependent methyltransferase